MGNTHLHRSNSFTCTTSFIASDLSVTTALANASAAMRPCNGGVHVTDRTAGGRVFAAIENSSVEIDLSASRSTRPGST